MVNQKNYTARICISEKNKKIFRADVFKEYIKDYPERQGSTITDNELFTYMLRLHFRTNIL